MGTTLENTFVTQRLLCVNTQSEKLKFDVRTYCYSNGNSYGVCSNFKTKHGCCNSPFDPFPKSSCCSYQFKLFSSKYASRGYASTYSKPNPNDHNCTRHLHS